MTNSLKGRLLPEHGLTLACQALWILPHWLAGVHTSGLWNMTWGSLWIIIVVQWIWLITDLSSNDFWENMNLFVSAGAGCCCLESHWLAHLRTTHSALWWKQHKNRTYTKLFLMGYYVVWMHQMLNFWGLNSPYCAPLPQHEETFAAGLYQNKNEKLLLTLQKWNIICVLVLIYS